MPPVPHKDFSDLYEKLSGNGASASEAHRLWRREQRKHRRKAEVSAVAHAAQPKGDDNWPTNVRQAGRQLANPAIWAVAAQRRCITIAQREQHVCGMRARLAAEAAQEPAAAAVARAAPPPPETAPIGTLVPGSCAVRAVVWARRSSVPSAARARNSGRAHCPYHTDRHTADMSACALEHPSHLHGQLAHPVRASDLPSLEYSAGDEERLGVHALYCVQ